MISASLRKSVTDLTHRRARTFFAVTTLALAVASISFFAIPTSSTTRCRRRCAPPDSRMSR